MQKSSRFRTRTSASSVNRSQHLFKKINKASGTFRQSNLIRLFFYMQALFTYFVALNTRKYRNLGIFGLSVLLLFEVEFEKEVKFRPQTAVRKAAIF
jgi:hypothetical protein